jgi:hypothetical protein
MGLTENQVTLLIFEFLTNPRGIVTNITKIATYAGTVTNPSGIGRNPRIEIFILRLVIIPGSPE